MDLQFLKDQIEDELCDSKKYAKLAIELKPMTDAWSKKFYEMSTDEHKHATALYAMFNEYYTKVSANVESMPAYATDLCSEVSEIFATHTAVIKELWSIYK